MSLLRPRYPVYATEDGRFYPVEKNGVTLYYPSVTTALKIIDKPGLNAWRANLGPQAADEISTEATSLGSQVHDAIDNINNGGIPDDPNPDVMAILDSYIRWKATAIEDIHVVEMPYFSHKYRFAGTVDLVARLKGDKVWSVIDFKTSKGFWPEMALQLAAYDLAIRETYANLAEFNNMKRLVVRLDKMNPGAPPQVKEYQNGPEAESHFLYALALYRYLRPIKQPTLGGNGNGNGNGSN